MATSLNSPLLKLPSDQNEVLQYKAISDQLTRDTTQSLWQSCIHKVVGIVSAAPGLINAALSGNTQEQYIKVIKEAGFEVKQVSIEHNGQHIHAFVIGKKETLDNGRWTIFFNGLGEPSLKVQKPALLSFCDQTSSNLVLFNYLGYGSSSDVLPSKTTYLDSARAVMQMVQDDKTGLKAKQVCLFGSSLGGGIVGALLEEHEDLVSSSDIEYVVIKDRTFSSVDQAASGVSHTLAINFGLPKIPGIDVLSKECAWDLSSINSSRKLTHIPEIVLQNAHPPKPSKSKTKTKTTTDFKPYKLKSTKELTDTDNMISKEASLAFAMLNDDSFPKDNKTVLGTCDKHFKELSETTVKEIALCVINFF